MTNADLHREIVDRLADLVTDIIVDPSHVEPQKVDWFLGQDAKLLNRAVTNYAASAYREICRIVGGNPADSRLQTAMLVPLTPIQLISTVPPLTDQALRDLHSECEQPKNTTEPLEIHLSYEFAASASALVLNGAVPLLVDLVVKLLNLQPIVREGMNSRPFDPRAAGSQLQDAQAAVLDHMRARLHEQE
ncbi:hypothetical protein [uncultured Williamsia sp.]|uniref:hypothetical protein n=1 Tax=uncultured Williamsia sp. TaxID=259311 RepID=UPI00263A1B14|nr:hypothetical protein [uncultured Williamsia sp.]